MCGNSCARTGSATKYGPATRPSSMPAATRGTSSCKCPNKSLPSPSAGGHYKRSADRAVGIIDAACLKFGNGLGTDHAAIGDDAHVADPEAIAQPGHDRQQGFDISGIA